MKTTLPLDEETRADLTAEFGRLMGIAGKPESFLMVGLEERCDLRFAGKPMEKGALIAMQQVGELSRDVYEKLTAEICRFLGLHHLSGGERLGLERHQFLTEALS